MASTAQVDRGPARRECAASGRSTVLRRLLGLGLALLSAAAISGSLAVSAQAVGLPSIETEHMNDIVEWAYRNGAVNHSCGEVCNNLWTAEHHSVPNNASGKAFWEGNANVEINRTGLAGTFAELEFKINEDKIPVTTGGPEVGWRIGENNWMRLKGPAAATIPSAEGWCAPVVKIQEPPYTLSPTFHEHPGLSGPSWLMACLQNLIAEESECGTVGNLTPAGGGWSRRRWWWNDAGCTLEGKEVKVPYFAIGYTAPFSFSAIEEWKGQKLEGPGTANIQTVGSDPGTTKVKEAIEAELELSTALSRWLQFALEGEHGPNPLETSASEDYGPVPPSAPNGPECFHKDPVNCATGNEVETQTDLSVGGRGPGLHLVRTYNAQLAAEQTTHGPFGYGWTGAYSGRLELAEGGNAAIVYEDGGNTVRFNRAGEQWVPANSLVQAKLTSEGSSYRYTLPSQTVLHFNSSGTLTSEVDRNGNTLTMNRGTEGQLESVSDPAGRKLTFTYNGEGLIERATDPMGHEVKYAYEGGNLASVTEPGEAAPTWQFKYDGSHRLTTLTDGRGGKTTTEYDSENRVVSQTDPAERTTTFAYEPARTKITEHATGAVTDEHFSAGNEPVSITRGYGTASAATDERSYDASGNLASVTDGNKHTTKYGYDSEGNKTSERDPNEHESKWGYDAKHDVISTTTPRGETTTIKRDSHGNREAIERPAPEAKTQITKYKYSELGELESVTDPLERTTKYGYNTHGDRTSETDPAGDKRTWAYDEDSRVSSSVSPRGNVEGGEPSKYTTKLERDARERPIKITDPLGHEAKYAYDANDNLESVTDPNGHKTKYTYDAGDERTKVEEPNSTITETAYDGAAQVTSQTDGNKHTTKYTRNILEQVTESADPLGRKTKREYDKAGNLTKLTDAAGRTTTNTYDPANLLKETTYSDGKTHSVQYEYDADNEPTKIVDGTGTTTDTYDQLDRLTETKDGHGNVAKYEYDLANQQTKITYPNGKAVTRTFDKAGRLEKITDWLEHTTKFTYDPDSDPTVTAFPTGTTNEDKYTYDEADRLSEIKMLKGAETLASLAYTRDNDGEVKEITSNGLPGEGKPAYEYDSNNRLTKGATIGYEYDAADNPTKTGSSTNTYDNADEVKTTSSVTYSYDELGERTKRTPTTGAAFTYGYDQVGNLISGVRPKEGKVAELKDTYAYDGSGLRTSQTISGTTTFLAWDTTESVPLILNDGTNSYVYGPAGLPVEQINNTTGTVLYLHHDQQGSTRLLTGSTGKAEGKCSYGAYGTPTCEGTATTPLEWDGQYTSSDTGLVYLRNRVYDPTTAQFLSVDPAVALTREPYAYGGDNPVNRRDPEGLSAEGLEGVPCYFPFCGPPPPAIEGVQHGLEGIKHGIESVWNAVNESEGPNDEGDAELREQEAQRENDCGEVTFGHGARHLEDTGLSQEEVERAIEDQLNGTAGRGNEYGPFGGRVIVGGKTIEYRGYGFGNGNVNIGTYYPVP
jgi:RHS repeat-associated protein